jgi:maleate cis-trans isomerase
MIDDMVPRKKVGVLAPRGLVEIGPYEFYRLAPPGIMLVICALGIKEFTEKGVYDVYAGIDAQLAELQTRDIDLIVQEGVPLQCLIGCEAHDARLAYITGKSGLPVTSGVLAGVNAAKHLGVRRIAFGNKFSEAVNESLARFFTREGIEVTGHVSWGEGKTDDQIHGMHWADLAEAGLRIGRQTFEENPDADAIYMPGGGWNLNRAINELEAEFGKPVLGHRHTGTWEIARRVGMWRPREGYGRLFATP